MHFTGGGFNSVGLSSIFVDVSVHELDDIESDRSGENSGEGDRFIGFFDISRVINVNCGS